ncbi:hypothetical protein Y032_0028g1760 [Ancylostoma ceylanicum]|nr:hypothetical protein Y032_0028g1760 [Ancylostoma ceylanicum]
MEQNGEQVTVQNQVRSGSGIESYESIMEDILRGLSRIPQQLAVGLDEHRVANKYREPIEKAITSAISETIEKINTLRTMHACEQEFWRILHGKGIESMEDFSDFIATTERDNDLIAKLCETLNTNVFQLKKKVEKMTKEGQSKNEDELMDQIMDDLMMSDQAPRGQADESEPDDWYVLRTALESAFSDFGGKKNGPRNNRSGVYE